MLGLYVSGHPLNEYKKIIDEYSNISSLSLVNEVEEQENNSYINNKIVDGQSVKFIGIVSEVKTKVTKNNDIMAILTVEDLYGTIPVIAFAKTYAGYRHLLNVDEVVKIEGRINVREDEVSIVAMKIFPCEHEFVISNLTIKIPQNLSENALADLREYIKHLGSEKANTDVTIINGEKSKILKLFIEKSNISELKEKIGEDNVIVIWKTTE